MQIHGKDWTLDVSDRELVQMAISTLHRQNEQITVQAVASMCSLSNADAHAIMRQLLAEHEQKEEKR